MLLAAPAAAIPAPGEGVLSARALARDGATLVTAEIQSLIDACHAAGGGRVHFPPGRYLTGSLQLKDNVYLDLSAGAVILGSPHMKDYPAAHPYLLFARGARNLGIIGQGAINGNGEAFWKDKPEPLVRPERLILFEDSREIRLNGIQLLNAPNWNLELLRCRFAWIDGVSIISPLDSPNSDGIDPNSSSDIFISNCYIETGDDAICPKSVGDIPTENIVVENCVLISDDTAIKLGTRSDAPIRNLVFNNIIIRNTQYGIGFYAKDGGVYENVRFSNILIETVREETEKSDRPAGNYAVFMDIERRKPDGPLTPIRNVQFSDITIESYDARCLFLGQPEQPIENLTLSNIVYTQHRRRTFEGSNKPRGVRSLRDRASNDYSHIPAHFTFAHVSGLSIDGLDLRDLDESGLYERHVIWAKDLNHANISGLRTSSRRPNRDRGALAFEDARGVRITNARPEASRLPFVSLSGRRTADVILAFNDFTQLDRVIERAEAVPAEAVRSEFNLAR